MGFPLKTFDDPPTTPWCPLYLQVKLERVTFLRTLTAFIDLAEQLFKASLEFLGLLPRTQGALCGSWVEDVIGHTVKAQVHGL